MRASTRVHERSTSNVHSKPPHAVPSPRTRIRVWGSTGFPSASTNRKARSASRPLLRERLDARSPGISALRQREARHQQGRGENGTDGTEGESHGDRLSQVSGLCAIVGRRCDALRREHPLALADGGARRIALSIEMTSELRGPSEPRAWDGEPSGRVVRFNNTRGGGHPAESEEQR